MEQRNIQFCLDHDVISAGDLEALLAELATDDPKVAFLAREFGYELPQAARFSLDAGIAFTIVAVRVGFTPMTLSPGPFADAGWDRLSDHEVGTPEWERYVEFCKRLCAALGVPVSVPRHIPLTIEQAIVARDLDAVGKVVEFMRRFNIHFVAEHWPTGQSPECLVDNSGSFPPCKFLPAGASA